MDEGSGTLAADSSLNGNAGTLMRGGGGTAGHSGQAVALDGVSGYVRIPHAAGLDAYPLTVAVWFKSTTTGWRALVNKHLAGSMNGYQVLFSSGNLCTWYFKDSSNYVYDGGGCPLSRAGTNDGRWHPAEFVVDGTGGRLYVDGAQKASRAWTGVAAANTTTQEVQLGHDPGGVEATRARRGPALQTGPDRRRGPRPLQRPAMKAICLLPPVDADRPRSDVVITELAVLEEAAGRPDPLWQKTDCCGRAPRTAGPEGLWQFR